VSCERGKIGYSDGYHVVLEDTILFPEGGGQPSDRGKINEIEVTYVERRGDTAVHWTRDPLTVGEEVTIEVDWDRRHDHMQQHSGQHLITAITDLMFGFKTTSWNLAIGLDNKCFIELSTPKLSQEQIDSIEEKCNEKIRGRISMTPRWLPHDSKELEEIRTRGLPDDVVGPVRVVDIQGVDSNMCCGTHVDNLSDIQCIKLLHTETKKGLTLLYFIAGDRVIRYLAKCFHIEKSLTKLLRCSNVNKLLQFI
jgi:misacylated tRNA(Ala) deacylase